MLVTVTMFLEKSLDMRLYQRTGYGDSQTFVGGKDLPRPFQFQGKGHKVVAAHLQHGSTISYYGNFGLSPSGVFLRPSPTQSPETCLGRWVDSLCGCYVTNLYLHP